MIRRPWAILAILTGLNLVNYIDRFILPAVGPRISADLGLSDFEFGLVSNAFMGGYFLTSPIFGALGDRGGRRGLIFLGVATWSVATVASGYMGMLATLMAARFLVGTGEASYATLAPTIIDDMAPPARKNAWLAVFYVAIPVGAALGYVLGGVLEKAVGWRHAFVVAGAPGLVLAFLCLVIAEPPRKPRERGSPVRDLGALWRNPVYRDAVIGYTAYTAALGAFAYWAPTYLARRFDLELKSANTTFGAITVVTGLVGTFVGGWLGDRLSPARPLVGNLRVCAGGAAVATVAATVALALPTSTGFFAAAAVTQLALFLATSPINVIILGAVPEGLRASAMAVSIFAIHAFGDMISPPLVGAISDRSSIGTAMLAVLPVTMAIAALVWRLGARRAMR
jgi:MFS family permease